MWLRAGLPVWQFYVGAKFDPQGWSYPPGAKTLWSLLCSSKVCSPLGVNEGVNIPSRDSPLGAKFTPRGKLILLKTGLCPQKEQKWKKSSEHGSRKLAFTTKRNVAKMEDQKLRGRQCEQIGRNLSRCYLHRYIRPTVWHLFIVRCSITKKEFV
jgi:hypothetical protein